MDTILKKTAAAMNANGFDARIFINKEEAAKAALELIGDRSVGIGGSMTIEETGLYTTLEKQGNPVYWHWKVDDVRAERFRATSADVYLASSNAVTEDGHLINIDGTGNRVAAMCWGPGEVVLIVGKNKIAKDNASGLLRAKNDSCGKNARRLNLKTPCAELDRCTECRSPDRMCSITTIIEQKPGGVDALRVFLVDEDLGF